MQKSRPSFYVLFLAALLIIPGLGLFVTFMNARGLSAQAEKAQSFVLTDLYDEGRTNTYPPKAGASVVVVFASWCPPCRVEHPLLMEMKQKYNLPLYGIAFRDKPQDTRKWLEQLGDPYIFVSSDTAGLAAQTLGVTGVPETVVLDGGGNILYRHRGPLDQATVANMIAPILASR